MSSIKDYDRYFDPCEYLDYYYSKPKEMRFGYQQLVNFWSQNKGKDLKVLEYGSGPVVSRLVSACPHVKDFVLADYLEANRKAVQAWIDKDPKAFDWRPTFDFIVREVEGKEPDEVPKREDDLRQKIRAIVPCDLKADNILDIPDCLQEKYGQQFDVVAVSYCLEAVAENSQEYKKAVKKLTQLVRPGGYLLMLDDLEATYYMINTSKKFYSLDLKKELVEEGMKEAGLKEIHIELASSNGHHQEIEDCALDSDLVDIVFAWGLV